MADQFKVERADEVIEALRSLDREVRRQIPPIAKEAAEPVATTSRRLVPRGPTGLLAKSIRTFGTQKDAGVRAGKKSVPWAGPVHFGDDQRSQGGYVLPDPFLYDALGARRAEVIDTFDERVGALVRKF